MESVSDARGARAGESGRACSRRIQRAAVMILRTTIGLLALFLSATAWSAENDLPPAIRACMSISRNSERLACFDRAVKAVVDHGPSAEVEPGRSREEVFGIPAQRPPAPAARE